MPVRLKTQPYVTLKAQPKDPPLAPVARGSSKMPMKMDMKEEKKN